MRDGAREREGGREGGREREGGRKGGREGGRERERERKRGREGGRVCRRRRHCFAPRVLVNTTFFFLLYFRISRFWCFIFVLRDSLPVELWRSCSVQPGAVGRAGRANFREDSASCWQIHQTFSSLGGEAALREIAMQKLSGSKLDPDILDSRRDKVFIDEGVQILEENEQLVRRIRERMNRSGFFRRFLYFLSFIRKIISLLNWRTTGWGLKCQRSKFASKDFPSRRTLTWGGGLSPPY